jgi:hypothetical protein
MSCGPTIFPTQYATKIALAMKLFFVSPAILLAPSEIVNPTTGPKNPMSEYPATGVTGLWPQLDFQIMTKPAITGRQQDTSSIMRMFRTREQIQPVNTIPTPEIAPSGNWKRIACKEE